MNNPFRLDFGAKPKLYIPRIEEEETVLNTFLAEEPSTHLYMIIGARGMGKTVMMTSIAQKIEEQDNWIHIDLSSENVMQDFISELENKCKSKLPKLNISVNLKALNVEVESKEARYSTIKVELSKILEKLAKDKIRLLITIDEAVNSVSMREFATYFQQCLRKEYPVYVIMTGLFKNIRALENNKSLTFLRRAEKINLTPLDSYRIATEYKDTLKMNFDDAIEASNMIEGYSYAFQMLGYLLFKNNKLKTDDEICSELRYALYEKSYEKIWEELSANEQRICIEIAKSNQDSMASDIKTALGIDDNNYSTYRATLIKSGVLSASKTKGKLSFALPFFKDYIIDMM
ncbi:Archaeal ATPase [Butyrivibrio fibrisolvens 16/4]|nr:Archaeal ATPase [Butyrivibrio fibrisolvens 16/4]